ncbi:hypothetical protein HN512_04765 [Candidatus Peregrinibacteria bacterium]|jgi:hypothetical protein|nr:hypothetical protein [Candidatus Peregrinibacteria bacterium]MBT3599117.1 hypothetical protein [Candidatus Peregrinibacteria bacterium]MBT4367505.1 hypothetical protein [Candidatus Peregrinibacteria bacterium]MBT4585983.1 hypothetical protein [Candidatus Peregrinibacteria bacterium]MBT6730757.1 hypothetical protein [Candidatus Peregrinibacteria bacterium]
MIESNKGSGFELLGRRLSAVSTDVIIEGEAGGTSEEIAKALSQRGIGVSAIDGIDDEDMRELIACMRDGI